jgi:hypothetical protein
MSQRYPAWKHRTAGRDPGPMPRAPIGAPRSCVAAHCWRELASDCSAGKLVSGLAIWGRKREKNERTGTNDRFDQDSREADLTEIRRGSSESHRITRHRRPLVPLHLNHVVMLAGRTSSSATGPLLPHSSIRVVRPSFQGGAPPLPRLCFHGRRSRAPASALTRLALGARLHT